MAAAEYLHKVSVIAMRDGTETMIAASLASDWNARWLGYFAAELIRRLGGYRLLTPILIHPSRSRQHAGSPWTN